MRIAVYGTLRRGFGNYSYLLREQSFLGEEVLQLPFNMVSLGGFPGLIPSNSTNNVVIEVFDIDEETARSVDSLEGYPGWYDKKEIDTSFGKAWVYYFSDPEKYISNTVVPNGDWKEYVTQKSSRRHEIFS